MAYREDANEQAHAQVFVHCRYMGYCQKVICVDSYRVFHVYRFKYSLVGFKALHSLYQKVVFISLPLEHWARTSPNLFETGC